MSEYKHTVSKADLNGYAEDPSQTQSNASSPLLTSPSMIKTAAVVGVAGIYGKKVFSAGYKAIVGQIGNSQLENAIDIGTKGLSYLGIGLASGPSAIYTVPLAVLTDVAVGGINSAVATHNYNLENDRLTQERGTTMQLGAGGYFG